jgi:phosphate butyryltransferase
MAKAMIQFGGAVMTGLIWGAKTPIVVTSRGASVKEKYLSLVISAIVA